MKITHVGQMVGDMHAGMACLKAKNGFEIRSVVTFGLADSVHKTVTVSIAFVSWLDMVCRAGLNKHAYLNKMLVTIGEPDDRGWWPCAYSYDGTSAGVCEVREVRP